MSKELDNKIAELDRQIAEMEASQAQPAPQMSDSAKLDQQIADLDRQIEERGSQISTLESAARGVAQGVSFGFGDEITGLALAAKDMVVDNASSFSDFSALYTKYRDENRANNKEAELANPKAFMAGDVGGSIASTFLPFGIGAKLAANTFKVGAAVGAISGFGRSDELKDVPSDVIIGTLGGVAGAGAGQIIGKGIQGIADSRIAKQAAQLVSEGRRIEASNLLKGDKLVQSYKSLASTLRRTVGPSGKGQIEKFNKMLEKRGVPVEQYVDDIIKNVPFRNDMSPEMVKELMINSKSGHWAEKIQPVHDVIDQMRPEGLIDPEIVMKKIQQNIVDEFPMLPRQDIIDAVTRTSLELQTAMEKGKLLTLNAAQELKNSINVNFSKVGDDLNKNYIQAAAHRAIRDSQASAVESILSASEKQAYKTSMRIYANISETAKYADTNIAKHLAEVDQFGESTIRLKNAVQDIASGLRGDIRTAVGAGLKTVSKPGQVVNDLANVIGHELHVPRAVNEVVSLTKIHNALLTAPGKWNVMANRIIGAAGRDAPEFIKSIGLLESHVNLESSPIQLHSQDIFQKQSDILNIIEDSDPNLYKVVKQAYEQGDENTLGSIISSAKKMPQFAKFIQDSGPGFVNTQGQRVLATELDRAEARKIIDQAPIGTRQKTMANRVIKAGIMPPIPPRENRQLPVSVHMQNAKGQKLPPY